MLDIVSVESSVPVQSNCNRHSNGIARALLEICRVSDLSNPSVKCYNHLHCGIRSRYSPTVVCNSGKDVSRGDDWGEAAEKPRESSVANAELLKEARHYAADLSGDSDKAL